MANIPTDEKVFMVDRRTNTTYGGSAALQAMQEWYTMQDVIDTVDANLPSGGITGSGTLNYVPKFTDTEEVGDSQIFDDGTNVGIGTDTPTTKLQVAGTVNMGFESVPGTYLDIAQGSATLGANGNDFSSSVTIQDGTISLGFGSSTNIDGVLAVQTTGTYFNSLDTGATFGIKNDPSPALYSRKIISSSQEPNNPGAPVAWIKIYDVDSEGYFFIPAYQ